MQRKMVLKTIELSCGNDIFVGHGKMTIFGFVVRRTENEMDEWYADGPL